MSYLRGLANLGFLWRHCKSRTLALGLTSALLVLPSVSFSETAKGVKYDPQQVANNESALRSLLARNTAAMYGVKMNSFAGKRLAVFTSGKVPEPVDFSKLPTETLVHLRGKSPEKLVEPDYREFARKIAKQGEDIGRRIVAGMKAEIKLPEDERPVSQGQEMFKKNMQDMFTPQDVPTCSDDWTERFSMKGVSADDIFDSKKVKKKAAKNLKRGRSYFDLLILPEHAPKQLKAVTTTMQDAFGKNTLITHFSKERGDLLSLQVNEAGIECLPYRLRVVGKRKHIHYGKDALSNFDKKKEKGELHPEVKRRINEFL